MPAAGRVVFVADEFADNFLGGAALSLQTHIDTSPLPWIRVLSAESNPEQYSPATDFLVFGNFFRIQARHLAALADGDWGYVVEECDYKYCRYRSRHVHRFELKEECRCHVEGIWPAGPALPAPGASPLLEIDRPARGVLSAVASAVRGRVEHRWRRVQ